MAQTMPFIENGRQRTLSIGGHRIRAGETRVIPIKFSESYAGGPLYVYVHVTRGQKRGPRIAMTGTVHGDELNGMGILRALLYPEPPKIRAGTLVCVPTVNVLGLENHSRYMPDRRDLNRCFPGSETGSMSSRLASVLFNEVIKKCDYLLDFHSAAVRRTNYPNVRADLRNPGVRMLARAFGCELIVDGKGPEGSLRRGV